MKGLTYKAADVIGSLIDSIGSFDDAVAKVIELAEASTSTDTNNSKPLNNKTMN
jgi:flavin-binding protein dodecin